jgi:hypothetical protein
MRRAAFFALASVAFALAPAPPPVTTPPAPGLFGVLSRAQLSRIDPKTGGARAVGPGLSYEAVGQNLAAVDEANAVYYVLGYNLTSNSTNLVGLSLESGEIVSDVATPFVLPGFFATGECFLAFSAARGRAVLAGQRSVGAANYSFVLLDPVTGDFDVVAELPLNEYGPVGYAPQVLVPAHDEFVVMYAVNPGANEVLSLVSVRLDGSGVSLWDADCGDAVVLDLDESSGLVYGIGQDRAHDFERALFVFDASGKNCSRVGADIGAFETLVVGEGAIDSKERILYWTSMPSNATKPPFPPVDLVGTSLVDGKTRSAHPYVGDGDPAQLRFFNGAAQR